MKLCVLFFAGLRDQTGASEFELEVPGEEAHLSLLTRELCGNFPRLTLHGVRFAVDEEFTVGDPKLQSGQVLALIPPVSGG